MILSNFLRKWISSLLPSPNIDTKETREETGQPLLPEQGSCPGKKKKILPSGTRVL